MLFPVYTDTIKALVYWWDMLFPHAADKLFGFWHIPADLSNAR